MASTPASSEVDPEEDAGEIRLDVHNTGQAAEYPDFAIIWSFLVNFKHLLHFPDLTLDNLEDGFNNHSPENGNVEMLVELYVKLLRRLGISVNVEKWEKSLLKVAKEHSMDCAWDLEQFGYEELKVSSKLELFKLLLESQFDQNEKLKSSVNKTFEADELRMQPIGRDLDGFIYWYHEDGANGVRLYTTEEDEVSCESWRLLARETDELASIVEYLETKSVVNPKEIALAKREEMKKKGEIKSPGKKRGRKSKKKESIQEEDYDDDNPCARCFSNVRPDSILLCDKCDAAYHTACLRPPLLTVPQGDWFCPFCQQLALLDILKEKKTRLAARLKLRQRQAKRLGFAGIDLNNILQRTSDDEEDLGIRRSGRSRKNVDYTFKEFEDDITSAVENDKKRFKGEEVNGEEKHLLFSKPAYESGNLERLHQRNTRRSRRLMDLDYESGSESPTSGYEYEGNSDEDVRRKSEALTGLRRTRRIIDEDDDDNDSKDGEDSTRTEGKKGNERDNEDSSKEKAVTSESKGNRKDDKKSDNERLKTSVNGGEAVKTNVASSGSEAEAVNIPPAHALHGNKIHPHSRIASVAPVARTQPLADVSKHRNPSSYPPEGIFPNPPNFEMFKPQFPTKQAPNYVGPNFGNVNLGTSTLTGNNFAGNGSGTRNISPSNVPGMSPGGPSFPGAQGVGAPNIRTNLGGPNMSGPNPTAPGYSSSNVNYPGTNLRGQNMSGTNFGETYAGGLNNVGTAIGANFGGPNFGGSNTTANGVGGGFGALKSPTQNIAGSFWTGQNNFNNMYNYSTPGGTPSPVSSPPGNQTLPPPYPAAARFTNSSQYGNYNQQFQGNSNLQNNYVVPQQSGNFSDSKFFPATPQQPPPPYPSGNSLNANFYGNRTQEGNVTGNQWTYPEGYGYYPGQGNAAGQSF
nr:remodeling and spacing factor 1-like [Pocillopora verrucosa]